MWDFLYFRHHAAPLGSPPVRSPFKMFWEDARSWETIPPAILPSGYLPGWLHQSELINIFVLPYIIVILSARLKSMTVKKCEIKCGKNTIPCEMSATVDPAKRDFEWTRIELTMLNFRFGSVSIASAWWVPNRTSFLGMRPLVLPPCQNHSVDDTVRARAKGPCLERKILRPPSHPRRGKKKEEVRG